MDDPALSARRRALRAARVVTLGLVMASPGCYAAHGPSAPSDEVAVAADAGLGDAGPEDAAIAAADVCVNGEDWEAYQACCNANGWDSDRGCLAWGPFVPPADGEIA